MPRKKPTLEPRLAAIYGAKNLAFFTPEELEMLGQAHGLTGRRENDSGTEAERAEIWARVQEKLTKSRRRGSGNV